MAQFFTIHPHNPQERLLKQAVDIVRKGGVIVYPTDSCYALGCAIDNKDAIEKILSIRRIDTKHHLTLMCRGLSDIGAYAKVDNNQFRLIKAVTPGSYTFILPASREVPKRLQHPTRGTIGVRVPDNRIARGLLDILEEPMLSTTLLMPEVDIPLTDAHEIRDYLEKSVDLIIDGGSCGFIPTTVIDLTQGLPQLIRLGNGILAPLGL